MTPNFRFAILSAVSSSPQAHEDKASLGDQILTARAAGIAQGGIETSGPYVLDGYSRTGYVNLSDALTEIPPLAQAVEAAQKNKYDVLIIDNIERLGDLASMLFTLFHRNKKQIHSARQSGRIYSPEDFDPSMDESSNIMVHVEGIIQNYRLNKLKRGLQLGIRKRVTDGKYSHGFPNGYIKNADGALELNPPVAAMLIMLKDKFLSGASLRECAALANASGVPSATGGKWHHETIAKILTNPFFTGKVFSDRWKQSKTKISANGRKYPVMKINPNATLHDGNHPALWTWAEYQRILIEMQERYKLQPKYNARNFSGMLVCAVCKVRLRVKDNKYVCFAHIHLPETDANQLIGIALADALRSYTSAPSAKEMEVSTIDAVAVIEKQIVKVQKGFEADIYTADQAREKIAALRAQIRMVENTKDEQLQRAASHERIIATRDRLDLDLLPEIFERGSAKSNNRMMRDILKSVYVSPAPYTFIFDFR